MHYHIPICQRHCYKAGRNGAWEEVFDKQIEKTVKFSNQQQYEKRLEQKQFEATLDQYGKENLYQVILENHDVLNTIGQAN